MIQNKRLQIFVGYVIVIGIIAAATFALVYFQNKGKENPGKFAELVRLNIPYHVVRVLDGDTMIASVGGHDLTIRLIGMDTPEVVDPRKPVQCFGPEASAKAKEMLDGQEVYLEKEPDKGDYDIYGRVLAYAKMLNGIFYNEYMIENGFAREYTFHNEKYKYQKEFKQAQKSAQKNKVGLWKACAT